MTLSRRTILKTIALSPMLPVLNSPLLDGFFAAGPPTQTYLLLHGMFFMEFQGDTLCVVTPNKPTPPTGNDHEFYQRPHGGMLADLYRDIDWTQGQIKAGPLKNSFPPETPQFPASILLQGGPDKPILPAKGSGTYRCRMVLPTPKRILGYRSDTKNYFRPTGNTGQSILDSTGTRLGTITCLQYDPGNVSPFVLNYYAEHPDTAVTDDVNAALRTGKDVCGPNFDLQIKSGWVFSSNRDPENSLPAGVSQDDEQTLEEVIDSFALYRNLLNDQAKKSFDSLKTAHSHQEDQIQKTKAADIASCPQFGINHP
jgi:hypothetical protein